jgi:hypothetical protein
VGVLRSQYPDLFSYLNKIERIVGRFIRHKEARGIRSKSAPAHRVDLAVAKPDAGNVRCQATVFEADGNRTRELSLIVALEVNSGT